MTKSARLKRSLVTTTIAIGILYTGAWRAEADSAYVQTDLVSDIPGLAALTEPKLVNPWGMSHTDTSPIWTSNQGTGTANLFNVTPNPPRKWTLRGPTAISSSQQRQADLKAPPARSRIQPHPFR
jgi:hypothetical protein